MPQEKYKDFLDMFMNDLTKKELSVCGLNISSRKVELVVQAFAAFELKMHIIASSEYQKVKPESDYKKMLSKHGLVDPTLVK